VIPHPCMSLAEVLEQHLEFASSAGLESAMLDGNQSHVPKWHGFSILGHIEKVIFIARKLVEAGAIGPLLITATAWHDVGKVITIQYGPEGPTFHGHEEAGAAFLERAGTFPDAVIRAVRYHGSLKTLDSLGQDPIAGTLWPWLELCDELGKWTEAKFPPRGGLRTRKKREQILQKVLLRGVPHYWICYAQDVSEFKYGGVQ